MYALPKMGALQAMLRAADAMLRERYDGEPLRPGPMYLVPGFLYVDQHGQRQWDSHANTQGYRTEIPWRSSWNALQRELKRVHYSDVESPTIEINRDMVDTDGEYVHGGYSLNVYPEVTLTFDDGTNSLLLWDGLDWRFAKTNDNHARQWAAIEETP